MKHTQGEWKLYTNKLHRGWQILSDTDFQIASIDTKYREFEVNEANAKLIAAAPELLNALTKLLAMAKQYGLAERSNINIERAEAIIKKATE